MFEFCTVLDHQLIVPTDTPYLFERLGLLGIKSLCQCQDKFQKDDRLLKGNKNIEFFIAVFAPNLSDNNNKKVR
jgi:hypothetical protein